MRCFTILVAIATLGGPSLQVSQGLIGSQRSDPASPIAAAVESRFALVSAADQTGQPLNGLQPDDFVVENDGVGCDVLAATPASYPLALVIDTSSYARPDLQAIRTAIDRFLDGLEPRQIAVYSGGPPVSRVQDFVTDRRRVSDGIARLFGGPESTSHVLEAIVSASKGLAQQHAPVTSIVAVSAGGLEMSPPAVQQVRAMLGVSRTILHVVDRHSLRLDRGIPQATDRTLAALSEATHGKYIRGASDAVYQAGLTAIRQQLDGEVILEYSVAATTPHALKLALRSQGQISSAVELDHAR
jgi:hypothetical protein